MIFGRDMESILNRGLCSTFTTFPARRMSTQSLICEASSMYPSVPRRQGSLCQLDKLTYETCVAQLNELREARLPPPARSTGRGRLRRLSLASSQGSRAANAGSGQEYISERDSRCRSSIGQYGLEPELWIPRRGSMTHSELLNEVNMSPSSTNTRQRVWSETGRSCDETTIRASLRNFRTGSEYFVPGSRQPSTRRLTSEEQSIADREDLLDMSFTDSLMLESNGPNYERLPSSRKEKKRRSSRDQRSYHCYDNPTSLTEEFNES